MERLEQTQRGATARASPLPFPTFPRCALPLFCPRPLSGAAQERHVGSSVERHFRRFRGGEFSGMISPKTPEDTHRTEKDKRSHLHTRERWRPRRLRRVHGGRIRRMPRRRVKLRTRAKDSGRRLMPKRRKCQEEVPRDPQQNRQTVADSTPLGSKGAALPPAAAPRSSA